VRATSISVRRGDLAGGESRTNAAIVGALRTRIGAAFVSATAALRSRWRKTPSPNGDGKIVGALRAQRTGVTEVRPARPEQMTMAAQGIA
jgi:hypothetical protein